MKKILLFSSFIVLIGVGGLLISNQTFFHQSFEIQNLKGQTAQILTLPFSYYVGNEEEYTAVFYRFGDKDKMQDQLNQYVENLTSCYDDAAFCDTSQDVSIYSYQVAEGFLLHKITLLYDPINLKEQENATGIDRQTLILEGENITLTPSDAYQANGWETEIQSYFNGIKTQEAAVTGRGISLGASLWDVIEAYKILPGYGLWMVTFDTKTQQSETGESDETFATAEFREYLVDTLDTTNLQQASLFVVYYHLEQQWVPLQYEETKQAIAYLDAVEAQRASNVDLATKPYDNLLIYRFDFPLNGFSQHVADRTLAAYFVTYLE